jgi:hypothetical protein
MWCFERTAKDRILRLVIIVGYVISIVKDKELLTTFIPLSTGDFLFAGVPWISIRSIPVSSHDISVCKQGALGILLESISSTTEERKKGGIIELGLFG